MSQIKVGNSQRNIIANLNSVLVGVIGIPKITGIQLNMLCVFLCSHRQINAITLKWAKAPMTKVEKLPQLSLSLNSGTVVTPNIELKAITKKCFQPREVPVRRKPEKLYSFCTAAGAERIWQSFSYWQLFDQTYSATYNHSCRSDPNSSSDSKATPRLRCTSGPFHKHSWIIPLSYPALKQASFFFLFSFRTQETPAADKTHSSRLGVMFPAACFSYIIRQGCEFVLQGHLIACRSLAADILYSALWEKQQRKWRAAGERAHHRHWHWMDL